MNLRYLVGSSAVRLERSILASPAGRWLGRYPYGHQWPFDVLRFRGGVPPKVVFDVGANAGMTVKYLRPFFPQAEIHAFEPAAATFALLRRALEGRPGIHLNLLALGDFDGSTQIHVDAYSERSTLVVSPANSGRASEETKIARLDSYCQARNIDRIDILKLDVQGYEFQVLDGADSWLRGGRIEFVYAEVGFDPEEAESTYFCELHDRMREHGFSFAGLYELFRHGPFRSRIGFCNALYRCERFR